jgi:hypothetical protein
VTPGRVPGLEPHLADCELLAKKSGRSNRRPSASCESGDPDDPDCLRGVRAAGHRRVECRHDERAFTVSHGSSDVPDQDRRTGTSSQMDDDRSSQLVAQRRPKSQATAYFKDLKTMKRRKIAPTTYNAALPAWRQAVFRWLRAVVLDDLSDAHLARASPER